MVGQLFYVTGDTNEQLRRRYAIKLAKVVHGIVIDVVESCPFNSMLFLTGNEATTDRIIALLANGFNCVVYNYIYERLLKDFETCQDARWIMGSCDNLVEPNHIIVLNTSGTFTVVNQFIHRCDHVRFISSNPIHWNWGWIRYVLKRSPFKRCNLSTPGYPWSTAHLCPSPVRASR